MKAHQIASGNGVARSQALGARLRQLRADRGLIAADVASRAGVSPSFLSQVERGIASPSLKVLQSLASALEVSVGALVDEAGGGRDFDTNRRRRPQVVRAPERKVLRRASGPDYQLLSPDLTGQIEFFWIELAPAQASLESTHEGEEQIVVLSGEVVVEIEGEQIALGTGDAVRFDPSRPHRSRNRSDAPAVFIAAVTPPSF
jgi:transcriptional regulator with XRE-family HTH domain